MYQPEVLLKIAHQREAELIREAELQRGPQDEDVSRKLPWQLLTVALICAIPLVIWAVGAVALA